MANFVGSHSLDKPAGDYRPIQNADGWLNKAAKFTGYQILGATSAAAGSFISGAVMFYIPINGARKLLSYVNLTDPTPIDFKLTNMSLLAATNFGTRQVVAPIFNAMLPENPSLPTKFVATALASSTTIWASRVLLNTAGFDIGSGEFASILIINVVFQGMNLLNQKLKEWNEEKEKEEFDISKLPPNIREALIKAQIQAEDQKKQAEEKDSGSEAQKAA